MSPERRFFYAVIKIPPSQRIKQEVEEALQGQESAGHPLDNFVKLGARYMLQVALEEEVVR